MTQADSTKLLWELEQRRRIEETLMDYSFFVDRNDPIELVNRVFCEDGCFELGSSFSPTFAQKSRSRGHAAKKNPCKSAREDANPWCVPLHDVHSETIYRYTGNDDR